MWVAVRHPSDDALPLSIVLMPKQDLRFWEMYHLLGSETVICTFKAALVKKSPQHAWIASAGQMQQAAGCITALR